jgi:hypothetical protein
VYVENDVIQNTGGGGVSAADVSDTDKCLSDKSQAGENCSSQLYPGQSRLMRTPLLTQTAALVPWSRPLLDKYKNIIMQRSAAFLVLW